MAKTGIRSDNCASVLGANVANIVEIGKFQFRMGRVAAFFRKVTYVSIIKRVTYELHH